MASVNNKIAIRIEVEKLVDYVPDAVAGRDMREAIVSGSTLLNDIEVVKMILNKPDLERVRRKFDRYFH